MLSKISNSFSGKCLAVAMAAMMLLCSFTAPGGQVVVLKGGTPISLELLGNVSSAANIGDTVDFRVVSDIKADNVVVIPAGSIAKGQISAVKSRGLLGQEGEVTVQIKSVTAIDGTRVALAGASMSAAGDSKLVVSIIVTLCCLFGFLIKGTDGVIASGTVFDAIVAGNTDITIE